MTRSFFDAVNAMLPTVWDFDDVYQPVRRSLRNSAPQLNVLESDEDYTLQIAAPGMTKEDVEVKLDEEDVLVISMEKKSEKEEKSDEAETSASKEVAKVEEKPVRYLRREFTHQSFVQRISLPEDVDKENIKATMEHGMLVVVLPKVKVEEKKPVERMISID